MLSHPAHNSRLFSAQVPSPSDDGEGGGNKRAKGSSGAVVGRWQETPVRSSSAKELRNAAALPQPGGSAEKGASPSGAAPAQKQGRKLREPGAVDVLQFLKYFHLVPAQVRGPPAHVPLGYSCDSYLHGER